MKGDVIVKNRNDEDISIHEASDFWDEHDFAEIDNQRSE